MKRLGKYMAIPFLLMVVPALPAFLSSIFARWNKVTVSIGLVGVVGLWWLLGLATAENSSFVLLGRLFRLDQGSQAVLGWVYLGVAGLLLLALHWSPGEGFVPAVLLTLSPLAAALMVRPFAFGVLFLLAAMAISAGTLLAETVETSTASLRYLLFAALAAPLFLTASWMLDSGQLSLQWMVGRLLLAGIILLFAAFPFAIWVRPLFRSGSPLGAAFVLGVVQFGQLFFLLTLLQNYDPAVVYEPLRDGLLWSGLLTIGAGALLVWLGKDAGTMLGSLVWLDLGVTIMLLAYGRAGFTVALASLLMRTVALVCAGIAIFSYQPHNTQWHKQWLPIIAFLYGSFSLIGLPLTPGFVSRWELILQLARSTQTGILISMALLIVVALVGLLRQIPKWNEKQTIISKTATLDWVNAGTLLFLLLLMLILSWFPQLLLQKLALLST